MSEKQKHVLRKLNTQKVFTTLKKTKQHKIGFESCLRARKAKEGKGTLTAADNVMLTDDGTGK